MRHYWMSQPLSMFLTITCVLSNVVLRACGKRQWVEKQLEKCFLWTSFCLQVDKGTVISLSRKKKLGERIEYRWAGESTTNPSRNPLQDLPRRIKTQSYTCQYIKQLSLQTSSCNRLVVGHKLVAPVKQTSDDNHYDRKLFFDDNDEDNHTLISIEKDQMKNVMRFFHVI